MIYRPKNKKNPSKFILVLILIFIILRLFDNSFVIKIFDYPVNYILESQNYLFEPIKNKIVYFQDKEILTNKINELEKENLELKLNQIFNQSNIQEFEYFIEHFGTIQEQKELFRVVMQPPSAPFDIIKITGNLIDYNKDDFVLYKNILIGQIVEKNNKYASVKLFSSPDTSTTILIKGSQFEAKGLGGGRYMFEVAKDFEIEEGDVVLYPDQYPFIIGLVGLIESTQEELFKKIYFNIPIALKSLSYVSIVKRDIYEQI